MEHLGNQRSCSLYCMVYGCFQKQWYPRIIHFSRVFHYKPSTVGYPHFWKLRKHPYTSLPISLTSPGFRLANNNSCESMKAPGDYKMSLSNIQGAIGLVFCWRGMESRVCTFFVSDFEYRNQLDYLVYI